MRKFLAGGVSAIFLLVLLGVIPVQARPQSEAAGYHSGHDSCHCLMLEIHGVSCC